MLTVAENDIDDPEQKEALIRESVAAAERYRSIFPDEADSDRGGWGLAWNYSYAGYLSSDRAAKVNYLELAAKRMAFNAQVFKEKGWGDFWESCLDEANEKVEEARAGVAIKPEEAASFTQYEVIYYFEKTPAISEPDDIFSGLYRTLTAVREHLAGDRAVKIRKNRSHGSDNPPYDSPKVLPENYDEFVDVLRNMTENGYLYLRLEISGLRKENVISINFTFSTNLYISLHFQILQTTPAYLHSNLDALKRLHAAVFQNLPAVYSIECVKDRELHEAQLRYGWAITVRSADWAGATLFHSEEITPGVLRITSVPCSEIFDAKNQKHLVEGQALEKAILDNECFTEKVEYIFRPRPKKED